MFAPKQQATHAGVRCGFFFFFSYYYSVMLFVQNKRRQPTEGLANNNESFTANRPHCGF